MPLYKNSFRTPDYYEETIIDEDETVVGTIRVKPVSILWKPKPVAYVRRSSDKQAASPQLQRKGFPRTTRRLRALHHG